MLFEFNKYSGILLVFFVHIIIYAAMLFRKGLQQQILSNKILAIFLLFAALFIFPWMVGFAGWYNNQPYRDILFYTPFLHGLLLGPLLYLYIKSYSNSCYKITRSDKLHFLPAIIYLIYSIVVVLYDKLYANQYVLMDGVADPDFDSWYQWVMKISIITYSVIALRYYKKYKQYIYYESSFVDKISLPWLRNFLIAFLILSALPIVEDVLKLIGIFNGINTYISDWFYFVSFALVVYYIAINGYHNAVDIKSNLHFDPNLLLQYTTPLQLASSNNIKDTSFEIIEQSTETELINGWKEKIHQSIVENKLYENESLTLSFLAKKLGSNPSLISKVINQGFGLNFNDFINQYRINTLLELLQNKAHLNQTLLSLAYDCGFNSKATFNRSFKKVTQLSPKEWIEKHVK